MIEEIKNLLDAILPAYQYQMPAGMDAAITYQPYYANDEDYESGAAITQRRSYRITVFQRVPDEAVNEAVVTALRDGGYVISSREWLIDTDGRYYQHSIDVDKWEGIQ